MKELLIDACGWAACVDANLNIDAELEFVVGPTSWLLPTSVLSELNQLNAERPVRKGLLIPLLLSRATILPAKEGHTDDVLFDMAFERKCATLTVDRGLKRRLFEANLQVLEVKRGSFIHLVDSL